MEKCGKEIEVNGEVYVLKGVAETKIAHLGPWEIGKKYFIRTVTMHLTGELVHVSRQELVLKDAAWIADSGRFNEALKDINKCSEVEPFQNQVIIGRGSIVDATTISNIITEVK
jgi:hypothetical protein